MIANLIFSKFVSIYKIRKNSSILLVFKIRTIRILSVWLYVATRYR